MERINIIAIVVAVLLIAGAVYASADFLEEDEKEIETEEYYECNANTCDQRCGGNCGIPSCGCS